MRTAEYLNILQETFEDNVCIESLQTETEWGTTYYAYTAYIWDHVNNLLTEKEQVLFEEQGIVPFLDCDGVFTSDLFDDVVHELFYYCFEKGLLE